VTHDPGARLDALALEESALAAEALSNFSIDPTGRLNAIVAVIMRR
jgi:hypothetical protein